MTISINKAQNLIIDLRDNAGGTLLGLELLLPYFDIDTVISVGSTIICSDDNITAFEEGTRMIAEFGAPQKIIDKQQAVLENMIKNKGQSYFDPPESNHY